MTNKIFKSSFHEKLKMLIIPIMLLTLGVGQMWGWNSWSSKTIYFDNSYWASDGYTPQLLIGRYYTYGSDSRGSSAETMTNISGTDLWYLSSYSYSNYTNEYFISNSSTWPNQYGCGSDGCSDCPESRVTYATHYTNSYNTNGNNTYNLFVPASASNNASLTYTSNSSYSTLLNSTQRIYQCVSENGGTPAKSTASIGTISISTKYLSSATVASNASGSISSGSNTVYQSAARTSTVTMTATGIADGYTFLGWYTAETGGSLLESNTTYTYQASAAKTVYARFSHETTHTVNITYKCGGTTVSTATSQAIGQVTASSITAPTVAGYTFSIWTLGNGISNQSANTSANPISVKTKASGTYTMQANYTEDLTSPWHLLGASTPFGGWSSSNSNMLQKASGSSTGSVASITINVSALPSAEEYTFKLYNDATDKWRTNSGYWVTRANNNPTLSTEGGQNNELIFKPDIAGSYVFTLDYSSSDPVLTVTFPTTYTLTYAIGTVKGNNGDISTSPTTASGSLVLSGNTVTLTGPAAKTGYTWKGWYTNAAGTEGKVTDTNRAINVTMSADKTLYACYTENTFNVSASASPAAGGSVTPTSATSMGQVNGGNITASPNPGYSFTSWAIATGSGYFGASGTSVTSNTANTKFRPTAASTLTASFSEVMQTVSVVSNNTYLGSVSAASLTNVGPATKSAEVTATPEDGATFTRWDVVSGITIADGYTNTSNPVKINATAASKTLTAVFTETKHTVTLTTADAGKGTVGSNQSVGKITAVQITATPKSGYMFSKWVKTAGSGTVTYYTGPGNGQVTDASGEEKETTYICVTGAVTLQATWEPDRSSGYVVYYGNDGKNADGGSDPSQARAWKDGKLYRPTTAASNTSSFTFTAGVADVDKVIEFKVHKLDGDKWYGYGSNAGGKIDGNITNVALKESYGNGRLCITMPGSYTFTWNSSNNQLSISYPTDVYYVRGGWDSWAWSHPMTETSSGVYEATINMTEANHTYTANTEAGFKVLIAGQYYGKNGTTFTRSTSTGSAEVSGCSTSGQNLGLTTDYTGDYTFKYTESGNKLQITYPTAYKVTYGKGSVDGSASTCSAVDIDNSNASVTSNSTWVKDGHRVKLTAPDEKTGYTWKGWYTNAGGTGEISTNKVCTLTVNSAKTAYACYTENEYNETVAISPAGWGTTTPSAGTVPIKQDNGTSITATAGDDYAFVNWTYSGGGIALKSPSTATSNPATFTATSTGGTITANFADKWNIKGDQWNNWNTYKPLSKTAANTYGTTIDLVKGTKYQFKVIQRGASDTWYGNTNKAGNHVFHRGEGAFTTVAEGMNNNLEITPDVSGTYTFSINTSGATPVITITYQSAYTVTFGYGTGGSAVTASGTTDGAISSGNYVKAGDNVTFTQTPSSSGYTFKGWYTTADGNTTVTGMNTSDNVLDAIAANANVYAQYTPNNYDVSFNKNGGEWSGDAPSPLSVTFGSAYGTLPDGPIPSGADAFVGWYTESSGGTKVTAETIVSTASDHTLYAHFESTFNVTVQYKCGDVVLRSPTTTDASESSVAATIIAPEVLGYDFYNWTGTNATFADASNDTTTVHVTSATTVTANYNAVPMVYFKNNVEWDSVFVSFDCGWTDGSKAVPTNNTKPYYKMTQLGSSDIFYCRIPSDIVSSWKGNIAFDNNGGFGNYKTTNIGNSNGFNSGEFLGRGDFDSNATMFIPYNGAKESRNGGTYYTRGCWLQYNSNYSGYKVRVNTYVQGDGGEEVKSVQLTSSVAGATEFTAKVWLDEPNYTYGVMLWKDYAVNSKDLWYTNANNEANTITSATTSLPWPWEPCDVSWQRCRVKAETKGDYIFTVSFATGIPMVDIEYPVTEGDFRLVYKDRATWNIAHNASWYQVSNVFKKESNREDIASFFVSYGSNPSVELQKCTAINKTTGAQTWTTQSTVDLTSIDTAVVYNFQVTQNADASDAEAVVLGEYTGNYYIRTDASDGGWNNYQSAENALTYSEYSMSHGGSEGAYSHYYMRHVNAGQNIKFVIANDYSLCLTDTMISDTLANEWIEREANVRFSWNSETNKVARSYISGSSIVSDRFLVLEGDAHLYDANGNALNISGLNPNEMNFIDDQNWVYEATVKADPQERIKLTAKFGNKVQYFYGAAGDRSDDDNTYQLIGGTTGGPYKIRVVYDFKTNRLVCAWMPDNNSVDSEFKVEADVMILRYHQGEAQQITFGVNGKLTDVKTVYGTMEFNKYRLNNQLETGDHRNLGLSPYERDLYFISFPFDVKLNDVFGFGTYGKHWIIEYYDGKGRAATGFWKDSPTNWKFVTKAMRDNFTLKAGEGYVLALDLDQLGFSSSVWSYGVENVYLYFPSTATVDKINATSVTIDIDQDGYECTIDRRTDKTVADPNKDRRIADSYWHLLGVPSYANANHPTAGSWTGTVPNLDPANWTTSAPYVYEWNKGSNELTIVSTASHEFNAMQAYMVQYARDTIQWRQVNATPQSIAARHNANYKSVYEFNLELQQNGATLDKTFINLRDNEEVTGNFDFNYDLCKIMYGANSLPTYIYTRTADALEVAGNCLPLETEQVTTVPVGVVAKTSGEYTFAMPDGTEGVNVTLIDGETGRHIDMAIEDYTVELTAGTYDGRFYLQIDPRNAATTIDIVGGEGEDVKAAKIFREGLLYIQRGDKLYDARGSRVE